MHEQFARVGSDRGRVAPDLFEDYASTALHLVAISLRCRCRERTSCLFETLQHNDRRHSCYFSLRDR